MSYVVAKANGPGGGAFTDRNGLRDGIRIGGGVNRAELLDAAPSGPAATGARRRTQHVDSLFIDWSRTRSDIDRPPVVSCD